MTAAFYQLLAARQGRGGPARVPVTGDDGSLNLPPSLAIPEHGTPAVAPQEVSVVLSPQPQQPGRPASRQRRVAHAARTASGARGHGAGGSPSQPQPCDGLTCAHHRARTCQRSSLPGFHALSRRGPSVVGDQTSAVSMSTARRRVSALAARGEQGRPLPCRIHSRPGHRCG